jgi:hypothetical protein
MYGQLSIIQGNGGGEGHGNPKTIVKTKTDKTRYKMDLMYTFLVKKMSNV